jgi:hypothetical protein
MSGLSGKKISLHLTGIEMTSLSRHVVTEQPRYRLSTGITVTRYRLSTGITVTRYYLSTCSKVTRYYLSTGSTVTRLRLGVDSLYGQFGAQQHPDQQAQCQFPKGKGRRDVKLTSPGYNNAWSCTYIRSHGNNSLKAEFNLNYIKRSSPYRTVNTVSRL